MLTEKPLPEDQHRLRILSLRSQSMQKVIDNPFFGTVNYSLALLHGCREGLTDPHFAVGLFPRIGGKFDLEFAKGLLPVAPLNTYLKAITHLNLPPDFDGWFEDIKEECFPRNSRHNTGYQFHHTWGQRGLLRYINPLSVVVFADGEDEESVFFYFNPDTLPSAALRQMKRQVGFRLGRNQTGFLIQ